MTQDSVLLSEITGTLNAMDTSIHDVATQLKGNVKEMDALVQKVDGWHDKADATKTKTGDSMSRVIATSDAIVQVSALMRELVDQMHQTNEAATANQGIANELYQMAGEFGESTGRMRQMLSQYKID